MNAICQYHTVALGDRELIHGEAALVLDGLHLNLSSSQAVKCID